MATRVLLLTSTMLLACSSSTGTDPIADAGGAIDAPVDTGASPGDGAPSEVEGDAATIDAPAEAATGDTWTSYAQAFMTKYCVECHNPADKLRDYNKLSDVTRDAALIRCGTAPTKQSGCAGTPAPRQFPITDSTGGNPKPSDAERARLVAWIDAGTP